MNILLKEFVNSNGGPIGGDYRIDQDDSMTTSPTTPPVTTDDFIKATRQGPNRFMYRSFSREANEKNEKAKLPKKDKDKKNPKVATKKIKETARDKMDDLVEDIFTKKNFDNDVLNKFKNSQSRLNGIPELESIREENPILIRKISGIKDLIEKNNATGEQKGIILNYLLSMDLTDIPVEYKNLLKNKIR